MDWIKKRYDQFILVLAALLLLGLSGLLAMRIKSFPDNFADANKTVAPGDKIPELDLSVVKNTETQAEQPAKWDTKGANQFLFAPDRYVISERGLPEKPAKGSRYSDSLSAQPIPNTFFTDNNLPLLDPNVPKQDPDKDGFTNEDEWRGNRDPSDPTAWRMDSTNPSDPKSHPAYVTKLFLKKWIRVPFRLLFQAYDGDPTKPQEMSFQINAVDRGRRTEFLKLGEKVTNSFYKLDKFEFKEVVNPSTGEKKDVSELTVINTETSDSVALVKEQLTDSPDSFALFDYECFPTGADQYGSKDIQVKRLQEFILLPEKDKRYKLIDIKDDRAVIQLPDGGNYVVVPDPRKR